MEYLDLNAFRDFGYLQEVNRRFLHPLGLALELAPDAHGNLQLSGVQDHRADPEGVGFVDPPDVALAERVQDEIYKRAAPRMKLFGAVAQPTTAGPAGDGIYDTHLPDLVPLGGRSDARLFGGPGENPPPDPAPDSAG